MDDIKQSGQDLLTAISGWRVRGDAFRPFPTLPNGGDPEQLLSVLWSTWQALGISTSGADIQARDREVDAFERDATRQAVAATAAYKRMLAQIDEAISSAVAELGTTHEFISAADFGIGGLVYFRGYGDTGPMLCAGRVHMLPQGHRCRAVLPLDGYYAGMDTRPWLVLGSSLNEQREPRPWYGLGAAVKLTTQMRDQQLAGIAQVQRAQEEDRLRAEERWAADPRNQAAILQQRVAELERQAAKGGIA